MLGRGLVLVDDTFFDPHVASTVPTDVGPGAGQAAYDGANYDVVQLFKEFNQNHTNVYQPYTIWSRKPYQGSLINIDAEGNRVTLHNSSRDDALEVWLLGGSTAWGTGAPDDQTIASHLASLLNGTWGIDARVRNLGESAYVSTQEAVYLLLQLQKDVPDVVIFYDGVNDAGASALWPEIPGTHHNIQVFRDALGGESPTVNKKRDALAVLVRSTGLYRVARKALSLVGVESSRAPGVATTGAVGGDQPKPTELQLGEQVINIWLQNYRIVSALGQGYRFVPIFIYQPALTVGEKPLHPSEADILAAEMTDSTSSRVIEVARSARVVLQRHLQTTNDTRDIHDLTDAFRDVPDPIYIDWMHVTGKGNLVVAEAILRILQDTLCNNIPANVSGHTKSQLTSACG